MVRMTYLVPLRSLSEYLLPWVDNVNELKVIFMDM